MMCFLLFFFRAVVWFVVSFVSSVDKKDRISVNDFFGAFLTRAADF